MSGKPKQGLDWGGWDTHLIDDDARIDKLIDAQGLGAFTIYWYLCQKAFATDGYFYRWTYDNAATTAKKLGGGTKSETIKQVVSLCLQIGLFDNGLFDREGILTNKDIQERYMIAVGNRSASGRTVSANCWLLSQDETKAYIIVLKNRENHHSLSENAHSLPKNATKESKVKESKVKESKEIDNVSAEAATITPSPDYSSVIDLFNEICVSLPKVQVLNDKRKRQIKNIKRQFSNDLRSVFERVERSDFLSGRNGKWNGCCFDWIFNPVNFIKIIEGNYDNTENTKIPDVKRNIPTSDDYKQGW